MTDYFDVAVHRVRAGSAGSRSPNPQSGPLAPRALEPDELTILTGWAQALAEALAYAAECVEILLANVQAGVPWRDAFQIPEPSPQLSQATYFLRQAVRAVSYAEGVPKLELLQNSSLEVQAEQHGLEMLVYRVLQSILEQLRTRQ